MKCRQCGKNIKPKDDRFILSIMDDPVLCSRECVTEYIEGHQKDVNEYIEEYLVSKEVPT